MKRVLIAIMVAFGLFSAINASANDENNQSQYAKAKQEQVEKQKVLDSSNDTSVESVTTDSDSEATITYTTRRNHAIDSSDEDINLNSITTISVIGAFIMPVIIVILFLVFNYKNKKEKYRVAEKAIELGREIPQDFFNQETKVVDTTIRQKGIKKLFLGLGLFIFLLAVVNFEISTIGLLISFIGLGQIIIFYTEQRDKRCSGQSEYAYRNNQRRKDRRNKTHKKQNPPQNNTEKVSFLDDKEEK